MNFATTSTTIVAQGEMMSFYEFERKSGASKGVLQRIGSMGLALALLLGTSGLGHASTQPNVILLMADASKYCSIHNRPK